LKDEMAGSKSADVFVREKYWEECGIEERVERLRDAMMLMHNESVEFAGAQRQLLLHQHKADGSLLVPLQTPMIDENLVRCTPRRLWSLMKEWERKRG
jgi:hypothetical protein